MAFLMRSEEQLMSQTPAHNAASRFPDTPFKSSENNPEELCSVASIMLKEKENTELRICSEGIHLRADKKRTFS